MSELFTGFRIFEASDELITQLEQGQQIDSWDGRLVLYPNTYLELRSREQKKHTILGYVTEEGKIQGIQVDEVCGVKPRNREQAFALHALCHYGTTTVILTGTAGTGKTLLALAAAMDQVQQQKYKGIILTKPMSHVGKYSLGALPGDVDEKFAPYLENYMTNLEHFVNKYKIRDFMEQYRMDIVPLQLLRGASWSNYFIIADEMQVCDHLAILTLGTRIGEGSKLVVMGDLNQRDEKISREKTGIHKVFHSNIAKKSPLVASLELQKCERSKTAALFAEIFQGST